MPEENEHAKLDGPEARYYGLNGRWYVELTVPHPDNEELPPQSMTFPVNNEWWAQFIATTIEGLPLTTWHDYTNGEDTVEFN